MAAAIPFKEGDRAPNFEAQDSNGATVSLSDFHGQWLLLYFYPRDDTPGCTREACVLRDAFEALRQHNVAIVGVSTDTRESHRKFAAKFKLPFPLLADPDRKLVHSYGVWGEKQFMGRKFMGTHRISFLIDPEGRIRKIWPKVKPETHAREVLRWRQEFAA
ncbi:MAG: thioredoxin-dependent thiol peroxidase [Verrucomicrobiota bacterium]